MKTRNRMIKGNIKRKVLRKRMWRTVHRIRETYVQLHKIKRLYLKIIVPWVCLNLKESTSPHKYMRYFKNSSCTVKDTKSRMKKHRWLRRHSRRSWLHNWSSKILQKMIQQRYTALRTLNKSITMLIASRTSKRGGIVKTDSLMRKRRQVWLIWNICWLKTVKVKMKERSQTQKRKNWRVKVVKDLIHISCYRKSHHRCNQLVSWSKVAHVRYQAHAIQQHLSTFLYHPSKWTKKR